LKRNLPIYFSAMQ